jgi:hypothetical protein
MSGCGPVNFSGRTLFRRVYIQIFSSPTYSRKPSVFPECDRSSFTPTQNKGKIVTVIKVFFFIYNSVQEDSRATVLVVQRTAA